MKPWNVGRLQPSGRSLFCRVPEQHILGPFAVAVEDLHRRAARSHHARAKQVREQSPCSAGVGPSPRQLSRGSDACIGRRAGDAARIRPRSIVSQNTAKTRKPPRSRRFSNGETRTRTGDTTIFSRAVGNARTARYPWKRAGSRRGTLAAHVRKLPAFRSDSGDEERPVSQSCGCRDGVAEGCARFLATVVEPGPAACRTFAPSHSRVGTAAIPRASQ